MPSPSKSGAEPCGDCEPEPEPVVPQQPKAYWYYCASAHGYYPTVPNCPEVWIKVPPRTE